MRSLASSFEITSVWAIGRRTGLFQGVFNEGAGAMILVFRVAHYSFV